MKITAMVLAALLLLLNAVTAYAGVTERVSEGRHGTQSNGHSLFISISGNGRYVAYVASADNIVDGDTNGQDDVFVYDMEGAGVTRVSVDSGGNQANGASSMPSISHDGRYVVFVSKADNLVGNDINKQADIFVHDRETGTTERASMDSHNGQADDISLAPSISNDGRYVAFASKASNLVVGDTNSSYDVFVRDRAEGTTVLLSRAESGLQGNGHSYDPDISGDGRFVVFASVADNLVQGDTNKTKDVFMRDLVTGETKLISLSSKGKQGNSISYEPAVSDNGRYVAFTSNASNLVPRDNNGTFDVFLHDTRDMATTRVSVNSNGRESRGWSSYVDISGDGRYVSFVSISKNLVKKDSNDSIDVFVHDTATGKTRRASVNSKGIEASGGSSWTSINHDGSRVVFLSEANNLVKDDNNRVLDTFTHDLSLEGVKSAGAAPDIGAEMKTAYTGSAGYGAREADATTISANARSRARSSY